MRRRRGNLCTRRNSHSSVQRPHAGRASRNSRLQHHRAGHTAQGRWQHLSRGALLCAQGWSDPRAPGRRGSGCGGHGLGDSDLSQGVLSHLAVHALGQNFCSSPLGLIFCASIVECTGTENVQQ